LQRQASPSIVIALAGNKADLANKRVVEYDEAQTYADENGLLFMETSAKTAMNVNDIFLAIGESFFFSFKFRKYYKYILNGKSNISIIQSKCIILRYYLNLCLNSVL